MRYSQLDGILYNTLQLFSSPEPGTQTERAGLVQNVLAPTAYNIARKAVSQNLSKYPFLQETGLRLDLTEYMDKYVIAARQLQVRLSEQTKEQYMKKITGIRPDKVSIFLDETILAIKMNLFPEEMIRPWTVNVNPEDKKLVHATLRAAGIPGIKTLLLIGAIGAGTYFALPQITKAFIKN